jgi:UDPglucose 6-dehydrogenase
MHVVEAVEDVNEYQKHTLFKKLISHFGSKEALKGKNIAIWGLAFKPETDDMREAPSLILIKELLDAGCKVKAFDPIAINESKRRLGENTIGYGIDLYDTVNDADALMVVTEWKEFRMPSWQAIAKVMRGNVVIDGRNIYAAEDLNAVGLNYYSIGRKPNLVK